MQKKIFPFLIAFISFSWFACKKVDIQFGNQFLDNGYTQVVKVDSFSVDLSTVYVDSFVTSGKNVAMIGAYSDPVFGQINSNTYLEVVPPVFTDLSYYSDSFKTTSFDSLALVIRPDKSYFGDTSKPLRLNVNSLSESIVPYANGVYNYIYNTRVFTVNSNLLGTKTISLRPNSGDSVIIRLDDVLGNELLKKFQDPNDVDNKTTDAFLQYFKGLRISADPGSQLIFGASDSVVMRLYYKKAGLYQENRHMDFTLANAAHQFNNITVDRSGTVLKDLSTAKQLSSTATANAAYTLYMAGAMAKLRFPTARDILKLPDFAKILKATLIIRPVRGTYGTGLYQLPPELRLSTTTQLNQIGDDLSIVESNGSSTVQNGNLVVDDLYGENTIYSYDISSYLRGVIADGTINANGLLLLPAASTFDTRFGRVVIGNGANTNGKMELQIIYAAVQ